MWSIIYRPSLEPLSCWHGRKMNQTTQNINSNNIGPADRSALANSFLSAPVDWRMRFARCPLARSLARVCRAFVALVINSFSSARGARCARWRTYVRYFSLSLDQTHRLDRTKRNQQSANKETYFANRFTRRARWIIFSFAHFYWMMMSMARDVCVLYTFNKLSTLLLEFYASSVRACWYSNIDRVDVIHACKQARTQWRRVGVQGGAAEPGGNR